MLFPLQSSEFPRVRPLFKQLESYQPMCTAVLEGIHPGNIVVDNPEHPQAAFLATYISSEEEGTWGFLAGNPRQEAFNQALNHAIYERQVVHPATPALMLACDPEDWAGQLPTVFAPRQPVTTLRRHYVCREVIYDWEAHIPGGFSVVHLDDRMLADGIELPGEVRQALEKWHRMQDVRFQDFGFIALDIASPAPQVAAWATVDFIANGSGDAGLFTLDEYRRRGLATVVSAAAVEYGLTHGLSAVHWTCEEDNLGSIRTAEKLGFQWERNYTMHSLVFDEAIHLADLAYTHLQAYRYREAAELLEQGFQARLDLSQMAHFDAARAWAALGEAEKAFPHLNALAYRGWRNLDAIQNCREFKSLHGSPEWKIVLGRIRQNMS